MPVSELERRSPDIALILKEIGGRKYVEKKTVHFCGLAGTATGETAMFLPRNSSLENLETSMIQARLTMNALARYGNETKTRTGHTSGDEEVVSVLPVIFDLAEDFKSHGLYAERLRYKSRDSGKPDWKSTIAAETPLLRRSGVAVYPIMRTTRVLDTRDVPLARIQTAVLTEIVERHGWWLGETFTAPARDLKGYKTPDIPRTLWKSILSTTLTGLYAIRPMKLARLLIRYLDADQTVTGGKFLAGVPDFERVWEQMLRKTITGVEATNWNELLPKPAYLGEVGPVQKIGSGMEMDMVVRRDQHLHILDAKYYTATGTGNVPKTGDIVKQLMYELGLKTVIEDLGSGETVSGAFVFPCSETHSRPFRSAGLSRGGVIDIRFPSIRIVYADLNGIMHAYTSKAHYDLALD